MLLQTFARAKPDSAELRSTLAARYVQRYSLNNERVQALEDFDFGWDLYALKKVRAAEVAFSHVATYIQTKYVDEYDRHHGSLDCLVGWNEAERFLR